MNADGRFSSCTGRAVPSRAILDSGAPFQYWEGMNSDQTLKKTALLTLLAGAAALRGIPPTQAATNVVVWDTGSRFADTTDVENRTGWKSVPSELFVFEADPPKAASDPGYYGRDYAFKGDAVVENRSLTAVFWSARGRVVLYSKGDAAASANGAARRDASSGKKILELVPL